MPRLRFSTALLLLALTVVGCTRVGGSGAEPPAPAPEQAAPAPPDVSGTWTGYVSVEDQGLDGTLQIDQDGSDLSVVFDAPAFGLRASGEGTIDPDGQVSVRLAYDLQCPGSAELDGSLSGDGMVLDGTMTASDCTGSSGGSFSFRR